MKSVILCTLVWDTKNATLTQTNSISFLNNKDSDFRSALLLSPVNKCQLSVASCDVEHQKPNHLSIKVCEETCVSSISNPHLYRSPLPPPAGGSHPCRPGGKPRGQLPQSDPGGRAPSHPHLHRSQRRYGRPHHRCLPSSSPSCCLLIAPSVAVFVLSCALDHSSCYDHSLPTEGGAGGAGFIHRNTALMFD